MYFVATAMYFVDSMRMHQNPRVQVTIQQIPHDNTPSMLSMSEFQFGCGAPTLKRGTWIRTVRLLLLLFKDLKQEREIVRYAMMKRQWHWKHSLNHVTWPINTHQSTVRRKSLTETNNRSSSEFDGSQPTNATYDSAMLRRAPVCEWNSSLRCDPAITVSGWMCLKFQTHDTATESRELAWQATSWFINLNYNAAISSQSMVIVAFQFSPNHATVGKTFKHTNGSTQCPLSRSLKSCVSLAIIGYVWCCCQRGHASEDNVENIQK